MAIADQEFMTAKELAALLRVRERKVYELASNGDIPCNRALGKLLFPREAIDRWLASSGSGLDVAATKPRPNVFLGSHDPLLEWALRESKSGLAMFFDGSMDGVDRFGSGDGIAAGMHIYEDTENSWNVETVRSRFEQKPVVLTQWVWRERGLIFRPELAGKITGIDSVKGHKLVPRQAEAGSQRLLEFMLKDAGVKMAAGEFADVARTETDAAVAVYEGSADVAFGLESLAHQYKLTFLPLVRERFDILVDRRAWFEPPMQAFLEFCRTDAFKKRVSGHPGYDATGMGTVLFNGAV